MKTSYYLNRLGRVLAKGLLCLSFFCYTPVVLADGHSAHSLSANVTLTSDYIYRGISQTNEDPALQGGFDYAHSSGLYLGVWASSLEFNSGTTDEASLEIDVYGGVSGELQNGISWDIGALYYLYPDQNADAAADYDFLEFYAAMGYAWDNDYSPAVDLGVAYSPDFYGEDDTGLYVHGGLSMSIMDMLDPYITVGYQDVDGDKSTEGFDYYHYAIGVSKTIDILTFDLSWNDASDLDGCDDICEAVVFSVSSSF